MYVYFFKIKSIFGEIFKYFLRLATKKNPKQFFKMQRFADFHFSFNVRRLRCIESYRMQYRKLRREKRRGKYSAFKQNQNYIFFSFLKKTFLRF